MYNNQFSNNFQNQASGANSQYRGLDTRYQPIGYVQSQYNQSLNPSSFISTNQQGSSYSQGQQFQSPQNYHTASYRGDQPGHDAYLRSDSNQPAQSQYGIGATNYATNNNNSYISSGINNHVVTANQPYNNQFQSTQSFHTANYRGDQPGHDAYLRSDSSQPAQSQYGIGAVSYTSSIPYTSSFNTGYSQQSFNNSYGQSQNQNQYQSPQNYHTANYRGNQPGHDAYLRSDSNQPAQSQYGNVSYTNRYQF